MRRRPRELAAAIHAETEGNPLFVGEVARLLAAEGHLTNVDVGALWTLGVPQGVREVIGRRLSATLVRVLAWSCSRWHPSSAGSSGSDALEG